MRGELAHARYAGGKVGQTLALPLRGMKAKVEYHTLTSQPINRRSRLRERLQAACRSRVSGFTPSGHESFGIL